MNSNLSSSSLIATNLTQQQFNNSRNSRLVQPGSSKLAFVRSPATSTSNLRNSTNRSSTFVQQPSGQTNSLHQTSTITSSRQASQQPSAEEKSSLPNLCQLQQQQTESSSYSSSANANTSGLPAPKNRLQASAPKVSASQQNLSPSSPIPSTVGAALRRRVEASASSKEKTNPPATPTPTTRQTNNFLSSRLPSPSISGSSESSRLPNRRSQSQRPTFASLSSGISGRQEPEKKQEESSSSSFEGREESENEEGEEEVEKKGQSLPPLKSAATYISRLINLANDNNNNPNNSSQSDSTNSLSEPISHQNALAHRMAVSQKPSQLVKPLVASQVSAKSQQDSWSTRKFAGLTSVNNNNNNKLRSSQSFSSRAPRSFLPSSRLQQPTQITSENNNNNNKKKLENTQEASEGVGRRLSLQSNSTAQFQHKQIKQEANEDEDEERGGQSSGDEDDEEDDEDDVDDDDDDDATTATSLTQMSDSTMTLSNANRELNKMIQMLTCTDNESMPDLVSSEQQSNLDNMQRGQQRRGSLKESATDSEPSNNNNKVIKSQSLSFNNNKLTSSTRLPTTIIKKNNLSNKTTTTTTTKLPKFDDEQTKITQEGQKNQSDLGTISSRRLPTPTRSSIDELSGANQTFKLARPRSRIIFDPTNSQFHVTIDSESVQPSESKEVSSSLSESDDSSEEQQDQKYAPDTNGAAAAKHSRPDLDQHLEDEVASMKLLRTQTQLIRLKYLPKDDHSQVQPNNSINRLKDRCRGSLDSLIKSAGTQEEDEDEQEEEENSLCSAKATVSAKSELQAQQKKHRRSPVGAALRSLFGLQPSVSRNSLNGGGSATPTSTIPTSNHNKVATIVRHRSLRSDPRTFSYSQHEQVNSLDLASNHQQRFLPSPAQNYQQQNQQSTQTTTGTNLGSELLHRASKKLSASSSSLTSKFKFMSTNNNSSNSNSTLMLNTSTPPATIKLTSRPPDGAYSAGNDAHTGRFFWPPGGASPSSLQRNVGLPPRMPTSDSKQQGTSTGGSSNSSSLANGTSECEQSNSLESEQNRSSDLAKYINTLDADGDTTIISDTSTLNGDSNNQTSFSKCAELERTIESLKNKLLSKEKDLTDLQLKQWSSDYLVDQLRSTISKLEKENAQLKAVIVRLNSANLKQ